VAAPTSRRMIGPMEISRRNEKAKEAVRSGGLAIRGADSA
jgi:hypothetical protein